ncbi:PAS domain-containing protein [Flavobacterium antarcticum]|uniref:PAS domain-containing protein n=1 Tax=Flavobacterium antarcticum TaxID=271155 RepID=UPI0003B6E996|nr:PAS domain-containing protein [Flavobacterium antarcticum]
MIDLNIYDKSVAIATANDKGIKMPLLSWDLYSVFFRNLMGAQHDLSLLNQLSKLYKWNLNLDLADELQTNDAIIVTNANLQIVFASKGIAEMSGYQPAEVVGNSPKMFQGKETSVEKRASIREAVLNLQPFDTVVVNYKKNGELYDCHIRSFPIFNKKGELTHFIALEKAA